ncbi:MAG TPA: arylsulfotransferase family protein [Gemmatimonadales bacterium]|nr:arylsulfotransferase family protein [Gemmatimonadales bacterium]
MRLAVGIAAIGLMGGAACAHDTSSGTPPEPVIESVSVAGAAVNVLSAMVTVHVRLADSVAVRYGTGALIDQISPAVIPNGEVAVVPILGLAPVTGYGMLVVAYADGVAAASSSPFTFTTDTLPSDLPHYVASGSDPTPGYVVFGAGKYGLAIDTTGRVVWYVRFATAPGLNFQVEPNGHYVARPPTPDPGDLEPWVELDPLGNVIRTFGCAGALQPRFHDLAIQADGSYWIMCDDTRTMDLSALGGVAGAQVMGTVIQHVSATGALLFQWSPFDHFGITDLDSASRTGPAVNWTHGNALDFDTSGNLLVSFRSLSEITKIDVHSGAVLWRMGGLRNQFTFENAPPHGFVHQHGLRFSGPGRLVLLDNLGDPRGSRAERYEFDEASHIARLVASYGPDPEIVAQLGGTTQDLPGGRTLVAFGNGNRVEEYDSTGRMVWHIEGNSGYVFRAQLIQSLYHPGVGSRR